MDPKWKAVSVPTSKTACSCDSGKAKWPSSLEAVWQNPTAYDALEDGPSYMPTKTASTTDRAAVARMVQANTYAGQKLADEVGGTRLVSLLTVMKALYLIHQTHHWRTNGASYYADHLLFQRIYEESLEYIDGMAERAIGTSNNPWVICPMKLAKGQLNVVHFFCEGNSQPSPEQMVNISLKAELAFLAFLKQVVEAMRQEGSSTDGVEDLIQGTASKHEEFVYLLQQRSR